MRTWMLALGVGVVAMGCGSSGGSGDGGSGDGGSGDGASGEGGGGDSGASKTRYFADITLGTGAVTAGMQKTSLYYGQATFTDTTKLAPLLDCGTPKQDGPCAVSVCTKTDAGASDAGSSDVPAGDVTITGAMTMTLTPTNSYVDNGTALLWMSGQDVSVKVTGAAMGAPAWQDGFKAPSFPIVTAPAFPAGSMPLVVDRAQPLAVTWTGASAGDVRVTLASVGTGSSTAVVCTFAGSAGMGTVPASSMGALPLGNKGSVSINGSVVREQIVGEWTFHVGATSSGNVPSGAYAAAGLTVQ